MRENIIEQGPEYHRANFERLQAEGRAALESLHAPEKPAKRSAPLKVISKVANERPVGRHYKIGIAGYLMGKSTKWAKKKINEGVLDGYLLDGDIVISEASINAMLDNCRITGNLKEPIEGDEE